MNIEPILYSIQLPYLDAVDLSATRRWLAAAWQALPRSRWRRLLGDQCHLSLEIVGTGEGIQYLLMVPSLVVGQSIGDQFAAHVPGARLTPAPDYLLEDRHTLSLELGVAQSYDHALLVPKSTEVDPLAGVLASLQ